MYVGKNEAKNDAERGRRRHSGHEESSSEIDATVTIVLRVGASGLRKERAISDLNANKRNLVQIQFGIVYSGVHLRMCSRSQRIACLLDTC